MYTQRKGRPLFCFLWIKAFCSFGARSTRLYLHNMTGLVPTQQFCHALHAPGAGDERGLSPASSVLYSLLPVQVQARGQMVLDETHTHTQQAWLCPFAILGMVAV